MLSKAGGLLRITGPRVHHREREAKDPAHSGNPAFRRPSISSFAFGYPPRAIHVDIVKAGLCFGVE